MVDSSPPAGCVRLLPAHDDVVVRMAHDLRTPLSSILVWLQLLRDANDDDASRARALDSIDAGARSGAEMLDRLVDAARVLAGSASVDLGPVRVVPVVVEALASVRAAADAKRLSLDEPSPTEADLVLADALRLKQMIAALLANAVAHARAGGRVAVAVEASRDRVLVRVADDGPGVSQAALASLLGATDPLPGLRRRGLGLAVTRRLAELHGGSLWLEQPPISGGAVFVLALPPA